VKWEDERYVRLYTRDTVPWLSLGWEGQALFVFILRKVDRTGTLDLGRSGIKGLAAITGMPLDVVERTLPGLLEDGCVEMAGTTIVVRNFIEAQEATMSPSARQKESRLRRRDQLRAGLDPLARETVIYFIQSEDGGPVKIGRADDLARRLVGLQTSRPDKLVVLAAAPGTLTDERLLHQRFSAVREKGEWFSPSAELMAYVREVAVTRRLDVVPPGDVSRNVTCHETYTVTPNRSDLIRDKTNQTKGVQGEVDDDDAEPDAPEPPAAPSGVLDVPGQVWEFYVAELRRIRDRRRPTKLADKDRKAIRKLVAEGMTIGELKRAVVGLLLSSFHLGQNDRATEYLELKYALREPQRFIALADAQAPPPSPVASGPPPEEAPVDPAQVAMLLGDLSLSRRKSA
jgi:hypothetical protein